MGSKRIHLPKGYADKELPKNVYFTPGKHGGSWRYRWYDPITNKRRAKVIGAASMSAQQMHNAIELIRTSSIDMSKWATLLHSNLRKSSKNRKLALEVTRQDIFDLLVEQDCKCQVSGIQFSELNHTNSNRRPWIPSVDRIDTTKGYIKSNIGIVCSAVNVAINDWGEDVFYRITRAIQENNRPKPDSLKT